MLAWLLCSQHLTNMQMHRLNRRKVQNICTFLLILIIYAISYLVTGKLFLKCPLHYFLHIKCPGCGVSHMLIEMCRLNFQEAYQWNAFLFITQPFLYIILVRYLILYVTDRPLIVGKIMRIILYIYIVAFIIWGIYRNLIEYSIIK